MSGLGVRAHNSTCAQGRHSLFAHFRFLLLGVRRVFPRAFSLPTFFLFPPISPVLAFSPRRFGNSRVAYHRLLTFCFFNIRAWRALIFRRRDPVSPFGIPLSGQKKRTPPAIKTEKKTAKREGKRFAPCLRVCRANLDTKHPEASFLQFLPFSSPLFSPAPLLSPLFSHVTRWTKGKGVGIGCVCPRRGSRKKTKKRAIRKSRIRRNVVGNDTYTSAHA